MKRGVALLIATVGVIVAAGCGSGTDPSLTPAGKEAKFPANKPGMGGGAAPAGEAKGPGAAAGVSAD